MELVPQEAVPIAPQPRQEIVQCKVPPNVAPGQVVQISIPDGRLLDIQIPPGAVAGTMIQVAVPAYNPTAMVAMPAHNPGTSALRQVPYEDRQCCCGSTHRDCRRGWAVTLCILTGIVLLWYFGAQQDPGAAIRDEDVFIEADATLADLSAGTSTFGTFNLRMANDNNYDLEYKDLTLALKLKQGGRQFRLAKYKGTSGNFEIEENSRSNVEIAMKKVIADEDTLSRLLSTCNSKGYAKLKVVGHVKTKGGINGWQRRRVKSSWNKCVACTCSGKEYCDYDGTTCGAEDFYG